MSGRLRSRRGGGADMRRDGAALGGAVARDGDGAVDEVKAPRDGASEPRDREASGDTAERLDGEAKAPRHDEAKAPRGKAGARRARAVESAIHGVFLVLGLTTVGCVLAITAYLVISGVPAIREIGLFDFLFGRTWASTAAEPQFGILPFILTSVYGTAGAALVGVPIGFLTAVFLSKCAPKRLRAAVETAVDLLSGVPSVVYGLVGMFVLVPAIRRIFDIPDGAGLLAAIVVLAVMILPSVIKVSISALDAVPREYEDASLALGASEVETWFRVSVPAAKSGIAASVALGMGRAVGEAMAVMMVAGNVANMPSLFESVRFLTTAIANEMSYAEGLQRQALFSIALVLYLFVLLINAALGFFLKRGKER